MSQYLPYQILNNHFLIVANRTIFWEEERALILSDLHLGKSGHFRKNGIGIPQNIFKEDMQCLMAAIQLFNPTQIIIAGDLFHSHSNKEHDFFIKWRKDIPHVKFKLVSGNHDILKRAWYAEAGIEVHENSLTISNFNFTHNINQCAFTDNNYCFSGHIHPGIVMKGAGRQRLQLPCFYFGKKFAVLPAFGKFTGTHPVQLQKEDAVFAIAENSIIRIQ